jgi:hypothetical protein
VFRSGYRTRLCKNMGHIDACADYEMLEVRERHVTRIGMEGAAGHYEYWFRRVQ